MNPPPNLTPEENEKCVIALRRGLRRRIKEEWHTRAKLVATFVVLSFGVVEVLIKPSSPMILWLIIGSLSFLMSMSVFASCEWFKYSHRSRHRLWEKAFEDNMHLPMDLLIIARQTLKGDLQRTAEKRLIVALNSPQAAEYTRLSMKDKRWLVSRLVEDSPTLQSAMLDTLEHFGGEEAVGGLNALINQRQLPWTDPPRYDFGDGISLRAKRVLLIVEARIAAAKRGETLLRPSVPPAAPDTFLRPSQETPNAEDKKQLLRASVDDTKE